MRNLLRLLGFKVTWIRSGSIGTCTAGHKNTICHYLILYAVIKVKACDIGAYLLPIDSIKKSEKYVAEPGRNMK